MTKRRLLVTALVWAAKMGVAGTESAGDGWQPSRLISAGLRHSDVALMPEGTPENYELFAPLRPTVVAWGEDALPVLDGGEKAKAEFEQKHDAYRRLGVTRQAANVWMLTATEHYLYQHPELIDAACVDLWGKKILPPWLADADYKGVKPWWGCTNNPRFQDQLMARMRAGLEGGATMIHLDDHSGTFACATFAGGCFCDYCVRGFRAWLEKNVSARELGAVEITDLAGFDYREFLLKRGYADRGDYIAAAAHGKAPLREWYLAFQRDAAIAFIRRMQMAAVEIAGRPVAFGVNSYDLLPVQLFDAHAVDYFANEVEQFEKEDLVPPVVYRLGEALGRPTFATGTGEDWIKYRQARATTRVRGWIAEAYAFGQYFMYAWKKWGFSEKTGTLWTEVDPEVFRPMTAFVSEHPELFDGFENAAAVGLLYDNASAAADRWGVRETSKALLDAGVPYGLVVAGDKLLRKPLTREELDGYRTVLVPPDVRQGDELEHLLTSWEKSGGVVTRWDSAADGLPGRIIVKAVGRVWALPRVRRDRNAIAIHFLNRDYDSARDAMIAKTALQVEVTPSELGGLAKVASVRYFEPGAQPRELRFEQNADGRLRFEIPALDIWGIAAIE